MNLQIKISLYILITLFSQAINAQVTIGSSKPPVTGALLELTEGTSTTKVGMPRVSLITRTPASGELAQSILGSGSWDEDEHIGLMVYNVRTHEAATNRVCPGLHVWMGDQWMPLIPYPEVIVEKKLLSEGVLLGFTHLDPSDPNDPNYEVWAELGEDPAKYLIGETKSFTDNRVADNPQTYFYTRYYIGFASRASEYEIKSNYSCDPTDDTMTTEIITVIDKKLEDGIWMNEHLRAEVMDPIRDIPNDAPLTIENNTYNTSNVPDLASWGYPNKKVSNSAYARIYTWAAATNGKGGVTGLENVANEKGLAEGSQIQGICPTGWHLPSDREYTDLENAIIRKTKTFSSIDDIGVEKILAYTSQSWRGTLHGKAMKSSRSVDGITTTGGASNTYNNDNIGYNAGFDGLLSGSIQGTIDTFGDNVFLWTSSSYDGTRAWYRNIAYNRDGVMSFYTGRHIMASVRCRMNND